MSQRFGVAASDVARDGYVADDPPVLGGREGEYVSGLIFTAEIAVQAPHFFIRHDADVDLSAKSNGGLRGAQECFDLGINGGMVGVGHGIGSQGAVPALECNLQARSRESWPKSRASAFTPDASREILRAKKRFRMTVLHSAKFFRSTTFNTDRLSPPAKFVNLSNQKLSIQRFSAVIVEGLPAGCGRV